MASQFVPNASVVRVDFKTDIEGQQTMNSLYFLANNATVVDMALLASVAQAAADAWRTGIMAHTSSQATFRTVVATSLASFDAIQYTHAIIPPVAGSDVGELSPGNVAFVVTLKGASRSKAGTGRVYMAGIREDATSGSYLSVDQANSYVSGIVSVSNAVAALGLNLCVYSRVLNGAPRTEGLASTVQSVSYVNLVLDSQRRRLPGRGR